MVHLGVVVTVKRMSVTVALWEQHTHTHTQLDYTWEKNTHCRDSLTTHTLVTHKHSGSGDAHTVKLCLPLRCHNRRHKTDTVLLPWRRIQEVKRRAWRRRDVKTIRVQDIYITCTQCASSITDIQHSTDRSLYPKTHTHIYTHVLSMLKITSKPQHGGRRKRGERQEEVETEGTAGE